jgi:DNA-binding HxlR family transcriptional regulator
MTVDFAKGLRALKEKQEVKRHPEPQITPRTIRQLTRSTNELLDQSQ